ncbi:MAG TPA: AMP-binding protein [Rhizomicrobium sp.]|nr:AMP-binding protein [Rhizomicrobium sp.]
MLYLDFFEQGVARYPDREIVREGDRAFTYREMDRLVTRIAAALIGAGLKPGSRVAIYAPNHIYGFACQYGILRAGCVWAPINYRLSPADAREMAAALEVEWLFFHSLLAAETGAILAEVAGIKGAVCFDRPADFAPDFDSWVEKAPAIAAFPARQAADTAALLCTSGTTGRSKGIVLSNRAFAAMIEGFNKVLQHGEKPVHLIVAPLSHAAGIYGSCLFTHGATNILLPNADPGAILKAIEQYRVTTLFLPPTLIYMLLAHPDARRHDYSSLRSMLYGAAPMAEQKLREALEIFGPVLVQLYGQSEALMMCAFMSAREHVEALSDPKLAKRLFAAGREGPMVRVAIMDDDGNIQPCGTQGEIVVRGDIVMDGYYNDPDSTRQAQLFGWHHTGDIGTKDEDGYIYVVDRKKEMIISGGFNIFPREVEQVVMTHPAVQDCAVVGIPDDKWGEAVMAAVELRPGRSLDSAELLAHCRARLGGLKAPKSVTIIASLPRNSAGKVLRREVRAPYWAGRSRQV